MEAPTPQIPAAIGDFPCVAILSGRQHIRIRLSSKTYSQRDVLLTKILTANVSAKSPSLTLTHPKVSAKVPTVFPSIKDIKTVYPRLDFLSSFPSNIFSTINYAINSSKSPTSMASTNSHSDLNRAYFNTHAASLYQLDWVQVLCSQITDFLRGNIDWTGIKPAAPGGTIRMLDYACGNGLASRALFPPATSALGIDVSNEMVSLFNTEAHNLVFNEEKMHAVVGDLLSTTDSQDLSGAEFRDFDLVVMSMALHHVSDPRLMIGKLVERVRGGGVVFVVDWSLESGGMEGFGDGDGAGKFEIEKTLGDGGRGHPGHEHEGARKLVKHAGFAREEMEEMLKESGCRNVEYILHPEVSVLPGEFGGKRRLFLVKGEK